MILFTVIKSCTYSRQVEQTNLFLVFDNVQMLLDKCARRYSHATCRNARMDHAIVLDGVYFHRDLTRF